MAGDPFKKGKNKKQLENAADLLWSFSISKNGKLKLA